MSFIIKFNATVLAVQFIVYPAVAAVDCAGVDQELTKERKTEYAKIISDSLKEKVKPAKVEVDSFMQSGKWTVVYASTPVADPGYFSLTVTQESKHLRTCGVVWLMRETDLNW